MTVPLSTALQKELPGFNNWQVEFSPDRIAWVGLDKLNASTNVLSRDVLTEFETIIDLLAENLPSGLIIYSLKTNGFISGADINEFPSITNEADAIELLTRGHALLERLANLPCTTVAMIDGYALGGGLELAMACDVRVVADEDKRTLGLPEVQLGLHPGFGGTVRAVHLAGVTSALPLMMAGNSLTPRKARKLGLVDKVVERSRLQETAAQFARRPAPRRRISLLERILHLDLIRPKLAKRMRAGVARKASPEHYPAPYAIIDLWEKHGAATPSPAAYKAEVRSFAHLIGTDTSRNLVRVYFLQERLKHTADDAGNRTDATHVHVVGAGIMGGDIATWCALQGLSVTLQDREMRYIEPALKRADKLFTKRLSDPDNRAAARRRLVADVNGDGVPQADIIIEAIFEDGDAKRALFEQIEPRMKSGAILATNTSSIPLEQLATILKDPSRLIGLHFFNPVAKLPLVEVVKAQASSPQAIATGLAFTRQIGKLPLPCRSHPGFLVNRILAPYMAEALELAAEGVPLAEIDHAAVSFGMPMGPIELIDSVGVDVALHVAEILSPIVGRPVAPALQKLVDEGRLGQKTGQGFYEYRERKPVKPTVEATKISSDVQERLMLAFVNEAAHCLGDQVVDDPDLIDGGVIFGTGFAPFRGGPLHYAQQRGIDAVVTSLTDLSERFGNRFQASQTWAQFRH
jgi:3-hydroxyacyl-CoA dehydrogenase / enoyl-CoA hydratase / 3-hydroxybutyryl-CoA epimerase